jgi:hypothetical protein
MVTKEKLKTITDKIEKVLQLLPWTRDSDIELLRCLWRIYYDHTEPTVTKEQMHHLPTQETVKRVRAKFNSLGMYLPKDPDVARRRGIASDVYREFYARNYSVNRPLKQDKLF